MKKLCKILFSRYTICALVILFEISLISMIIVHSIASYVWFAALALVAGVVTLVSLINREINPEFKVSWLVVIFLLPGFGALLYLLFYSRRMSKRDSRRLEGIMNTLADFEEKNSDRCTPSMKHLDELAARDKSAAGRALSILHDDGLSGVYANASCKYFPDGNEMFLHMMDSISAAEKYIFLEYFIIDSGEMWDALFEAISKKAAVGVDVRLIYDDVGCMQTLPLGFAAQLRSAGIKCCAYSKVSPKVTSVHNNRDHRKILVVDGKIAYTGGINIADEYIGKKIRFGHWKDGGIALFGKVALGFAKLFLSLYDFSSNTVSSYEELLICEDGNNTADDGGFYIPFGSGPNPIYENPVGKNAYMNLINRSEQYLYITTPYLVADYDLVEALRMAALRGVDVRIITPAIPDKKTVKIVTKSYYERLISAGVRIFEYTPGFIHEKLLVSDDSSAIVGTINLDYRSFVHHFECAVWIYGSPEILKMRDEFISTTSKSREIDKQGAKLRLHEKIIRYIVRVFAPLL